MADQTKQAISKILYNIFIGVAVLIVGGVISFITYSLWTLDSRNAEVELISSQISTLNENMNMRFDEADKKADKRFAEFMADSDARYAEFTANSDARYAEFTANIDRRFAEFAANNDERYAEYTTKSDERYAEFTTKSDERYAEFTTKSDERYAEFTTKSDERYAEFTTTVKMLLETADSNANTRFDDFTKSIYMLLDLNSKNADTRYAEFTKNTNMRLDEIIDRVNALEESFTTLGKNVIPRYDLVIKEFPGIISLLIKLNDPNLDSEKFNDLLAQVETDLESLNERLELSLQSDKQE